MAIFGEERTAALFADVSQRVRLETPKRTQTEFRKVILEFPHIVLSHGQVMKEVAGARLMLQAASLPLWSRSDGAMFSDMQHP